MFRSLKIASLAASTLLAVSLASAAGEAPAATGTAPAAKAAPAPAAPAAAAPAAPAAQPVAATPAAQPAAKPATASSGTPCEDVKQTIAAKLAAKGVKAFSLDVVAKDQVGTAKVVGSCQAGAMKITYKKG